MTRVRIFNKQVMEGDLELVRQGGEFAVTIDGIEGIMTCDPGYTNVKFLKSRTCDTQRMESANAKSVAQREEGTE